MKSSPREQPRRCASSIRALAALSSIACLACTTTSVVRPQQLERLDGYGTRGPSSPEPVLETLSGQKVSVGQDAQLILDLPNARVGGQFETIRVQGGVFSGRLHDGNVVQAPLAQISRATVGQTNKGAIGAVFGGVMLAALIGSVLAMRSTGVQAMP